MMLASFLSPPPFLDEDRTRAAGWGHLLAADVSQLSVGDGGLSVHE